MAEKKSLHPQYLNKMYLAREELLICSVSLVIVIPEYSQHVMALISQSDVIITSQLVNATLKVSIL